MRKRPAAKKRTKTEPRARPPEEKRPRARASTEISAVADALRVLGPGPDVAVLAELVFWANDGHAGDYGQDRMVEAKALLGALLAALRHGICADATVTTLAEMIATRLDDLPNENLPGIGARGDITARLEAGLLSLG